MASSAARIHHARQIKVCTVADWLCGDGLRALGPRFQERAGEPLTVRTLARVLPDAGDDLWDAIAHLAGTRPLSDVSRDLVTRTLAARAQLERIPA